MPGEVKQLIDELMRRRTKGNPTLLHFVRANLVLKGINPDIWDEQSEDNPQVIAQLKEMLASFE